MQTSEKWTTIKPIFFYPCTGLERPFGLQEIKAPIISRKSAHESGKDVGRMHRPPLTSGEAPGTHFA
jgi:hypothetical protein